MMDPGPVHGYKSWQNILTDCLKFFEISHWNISSKYVYILVSIIYVILYGYHHDRVCLNYFLAFYSKISNKDFFSEYNLLYDSIK